MALQPGWPSLAAVLQPGSCASYVLVFRPCLQAHELAKYRAARSGSLSSRRTFRLRSAARAGSRSGRGSGGAAASRPLSSSPTARWAAQPADEPRQRGLPRTPAGSRWRPLCCTVPRRGPLLSALIPAVAAAGNHPIVGRAGWRESAGASSMRARLQPRRRGGRRRRGRGAARRAPPAIRRSSRRRRLHVSTSKSVMLGVCSPPSATTSCPRACCSSPTSSANLGRLIPDPWRHRQVDGGLIGTLVLYGADVRGRRGRAAVIAYRGLPLSIPALLGLPALAVLAPPQASGRGARHRRLRASGSRWRKLGRGLLQRPELIMCAHAPPADRQPDWPYDGRSRNISSSTKHQLQSSPARLLERAIGCPLAS